MRRVLGTVLALFAVVTAAPATAATPAKGEIVFVSNGPAYGDLTLPSKVTPDFENARYESGGYVVLTAGPGKDVTGFLLVPPGSEWPWGEGYLPAGRSRVRLLADGPTTIRVPAKGLRGRLTVRLTRRLPGAVAKTGEAAVGPAAAVHEIPFTLSGRSVVVHGYTSFESEGGGRHEWLCLGAAGTPCVADDPQYLGTTIVGGPFSESVNSKFGYDHKGPLSSKLQFADAGTVGPVTHFVLAFPLA